MLPEISVKNFGNTFKFKIFHFGNFQNEKFWIWKCCQIFWQKFLSKFLATWERPFRTHMFWRAISENSVHNSRSYKFLKLGRNWLFTGFFAEISSKFVADLSKSIFGGLGRARTSFWSAIGFYLKLMRITSDWNFWPGAPPSLSYRPVEIAYFRCFLRK